jgi:hypothetical protein
MPEGRAQSSIAARAGKGRDGDQAYAAADSSRRAFRRAAPQKIV